MSRVRVKICGITSVRDGLAACEAGADALGFVLWPGSPRALDLRALEALARDIPADVDRVGVFVNATAAEIRAAVAAGRLDRVQLHGDEEEDFCRSLEVAWYRAFRVGPESGAATLVDRIRSFGQDRFLLDARGKAPGGGGTPFDWRIAAKVSMRLSLTTEPRMILAGGLTAENVGVAIRSVRPWGVDVSTGVESSPGNKDPDKVAAFVEAVRRVP